MNLEIPILGSDTLDNNTVLEAAQGSNLDLIVTTFYNEGGDPEFDEGFKEWINSDSVNLDNNGGNDMIAAVSVMGFDAYNVALEAIKLAGSTDPSPSRTPSGMSTMTASPATSPSVRTATPSATPPT